MIRREYKSECFVFAVPMVEVQVVRKETAHLPCDISLPDPRTDDVILVLWYREDLGRPIYRLVRKLFSNFQTSYAYFLSSISKKMIFF